MLIVKCGDCQAQNVADDTEVNCPTCGSDNLFMSVKIVNLTPHQVDVLVPDWGTLSIPASGKIARCAQTEKKAGKLAGLIDVTEQTFGDVEGLPAAEPDTFLIVSRLVKSACPDRGDCLCPGPLVRDADGKVVGCRGLSL